MRPGRAQKEEWTTRSRRSRDNGPVEIHRRRTDGQVRTQRHGGGFSCRADTRMFTASKAAKSASASAWRSPVPGARFVPLPAEPGFFAMLVDHRHDPDADALKVGRRCELCGRGSTHGSVLFLVNEATVGPGFHRSDVAIGGSFGPRNAQTPEIFVDETLRTALAEARLSGVATSPIRSKANE